MSLEGMLLRFKGMNKEQMIAKYNSKNCAPMWDSVEKADAKTAMKMLLNGEVPNEILIEPKKVDPLADIKALPDNPPVEKERELTEDEMLELEIGESKPKEKEKELDLPEEKFTMKRKQNRKKK